MDHRDRMQHLGRRAMQEPPELAIPPCTQTAECHKPVGVIRVKVERHGWGEGRLPIPAYVDCKTESDLDAECQRKQAEREVQRAKAVARAAAAAKMVREQKMQPHQQLDTIKARARAAKEFAAVVEHRNADLWRKTTAAGTSNGRAAAANSSQVQQQQQLSGCGKLPLVQRHIQPAALVQAAAATVDQALEQTMASAAEVASLAIQQPAVTAECDAVNGEPIASQVSDAASRSSAGSLSQLEAQTAAATAAEHGTTLQRSESAAQPTTPAAAPASSSNQPAAECLLHAMEQQHQQQQEQARCHAADQLQSGQPHLSELSSQPAAAVESAQSDAAAAGPDSSAPRTADGVSVAPSTAADAVVVHLPVTSSCQARSRLLAYACAVADVTRSSAPSLTSHGCQPYSSAQHSKHAAPRGAWQAVGTAAAPNAAGAGLMLSCVRGPANQCSAGGAAAAAAAAAAGSWPQTASEAPHWHPQPPATQLIKPLLLKAMSTLQAPAATEQQQQQQQVTSQQFTKPQLLIGRPPWQGSTNDKRSSQQLDSGGKRTPGKASVQPAGSGVKAGSAVKPKGSCHQERRLALPNLCSCGHKTPPSDPAYPTRCCVNCPLHSNPAAWQRLVVGLGLLDADN